MFLSFKTSVTYKKKTLCWTYVSVVMQLLLDITSFFDGHCPIPGANIQA